MDFLIRFLQIHEPFRQAELESIAALLSINLTWIHYDPESPFAIIHLTPTTSQDEISLAKSLISRSILSTSIHELWGLGSDYPSLHTSVRSRTSHLWERYKNVTFRFNVDTYRRSISQAVQREIIERFGYLPFEGGIQMKGADEGWTVFEEYPSLTPGEGSERSEHIASHEGNNARPAVATYTLKKRSYISTTSLDAELSLVCANLVLAGAGKLVYDPFMGTGSLPLACAHFGATVMGSDLDGRALRGAGKNVLSNFKQYGTHDLYLGSFVADLTHSPLKTRRLPLLGYLDALLCDPPYGVREGCKVLGSTKTSEVVYLSDGTAAHLGRGYIPPKQAYSHERLLRDLCRFAVGTVVRGGRVGVWVPIAEGEEGDGVPMHPCLKLLYVCRQDFNKWSRRFCVYERIGDDEVDWDEVRRYDSEVDGDGKGKTADELNEFRRLYFKGFRE
ncbi:tRNA guanosine-2'-O-methyltransferase [Piedraia hortae CBS 480.64]|uniref:tRNA (guanine(10)-N(2))-methyltransferase n=1 Tax=Piedraia hortae CBS 480.64 TaxID=1314780 RepID=A0A6A7C5X1_9PEZI|nr:tRNA guanosine-2'-O-methyltransferase [Piedraia hortae CBS 480.64]